MGASTDPIAKPQESSALPLSLTHILEQCRIVRSIVEESADALSSVNHALKHDFGDLGHSPAAKHTLERTESIESRLAEAFQVLSAVSRALASEVAERHMLNHQFAAIQEQEESARHRILHDALTGLPNRILFNDRLEHGLAQALRHNRSLAVMFIDLNGFKAVNDTYGHDAGDSVLQSIATRLLDRIRSEDTACRHGGDEFLYLLAEAGSEQSISYVAERIIRTIQEPCAISSHDTEISVSISASIGIAIAPKDGITVDRLIKSADSAMYRAKQQKSGHSFVR
jgi:diguanylate cyclase (GGDEF)-like protein